mgnify:CR=1 FL=1
MKPLNARQKRDLVDLAAFLKELEEDAKSMRSIAEKIAQKKTGLSVQDCGLLFRVYMFGQNHGGLVVRGIIRAMLKITHPNFNKLK